MLRFLFGKSRRGTPTATTTVADPADAPVAAAETVPLATRLAALAAMPDGDAGIMAVALATGPAEVRAAALERLVRSEDLVRVACDAKSADTRFAAAQRITDEALLGEIAQAVRTRDKRVYKLARERLDAFARERERLALQARWLTTVEQLAEQEQPELSRVMEVERVWAALHPDPDAGARFQRARARLHARFQAQAEERRNARRVAETPVVHHEPTSTDAPAVSPVAASPEAQETVAEAGLSESIQAAAPGVHAADGDSTEVQAPATVATVAPVRPPRSPKPARVQADPVLRGEIAQVLESLEQALEEGHVQHAETRLETLSQLQSRAGGLDGALGGRIRRAAEEIARLRAWRRWGGQQARDHLCEAAEALPGRDLPPEELGRAIKALRAQWTAISASEGGVPLPLWERFDSACEKAWEPVREHFARLAERRGANQAKREALLAELEAKVALLDADPVDWRLVAIAVADFGRRWPTLGPVDRKLAKTLETRFLELHGRLEQSLKTVREREATERDALIRRAEQLVQRAAEQRDTVSRLRELQAEWQTRSRAVPLDRTREQALWERFRAICDSLFQARDAARAADLAERSAHQEAEAAAFRQRSEQWRALREGALACAEAESAVLAAASAEPERLAAIAAGLEATLAGLPACDPRAGAALQRRQQRILAACSGPGATAALLDACAAETPGLAAQLLELEVLLGLPSPPELNELRRRLQLERLADALRSGGRPDEASARKQVPTLCGLASAETATARRLDAILAALAPQAPSRPERAERSERPARPAPGPQRGADRPAGARPARSGPGGRGDRPVRERDSGEAGRRTAQPGQDG